MSKKEVKKSVIDRVLGDADVLITSKKVVELGIYLFVSVGVAAISSVPELVFLMPLLYGIKDVLKHRAKYKTR